MIELKLSEQMLMVILRCLGKQPHDEVRPVIDEVVRQINSQRQAPPQDDNVTRLRDGN